MLDQVNNAYNANPEDGLKDFINTIECVVFFIFVNNIVKKFEYSFTDKVLIVL